MFIWRIPLSWVQGERRGTGLGAGPCPKMIYAKIMGLIPGNAWSEVYLECRLLWYNVNDMTQARLKFGSPCMNTKCWKQYATALWDVWKISGKTIVFCISIKLLLNLKYYPWTDKYTSQTFTTLLKLKKKQHKQVRYVLKHGCWFELV